METYDLHDIVKLFKNEIIFVLFNVYLGNCNN